MSAFLEVGRRLQLGGDVTQLSSVIGKTTSQLEQAITENARSGTVMARHKSSRGASSTRSSVRSSLGSGLKG